MLKTKPDLNKQQEIRGLISEQGPIKKKKKGM